MENVVTRSKFVNETISIVLDFSDQLGSGETITSCTIVVSLFTGTDTDPSNILYQVPLITGNIVDQKFRLGIPGCIYEIVFLTVGSLGTHAEKVTNLAILPQNSIAIPSFTVIYETSTLYPYEFSESLSNGILWKSAAFSNVLYHIPEEAIIGNVQWSSGGFIGGLVTYNIPPEYLSNNILWLSAQFGGVLVEYRSTPEGVTNNIAWLSAQFGGIILQYNIPPETLTNGISWVSGAFS